jgi:hypothetical protein
MYGLEVFMSRPHACEVVIERLEQLAHLLTNKDSGTLEYTLSEVHVEARGLLHVLANGSVPMSLRDRVVHTIRSHHSLLFPNVSDLALIVIESAIRRDITCFDAQKAFSASVSDG